MSAPIRGLTLRHPWAWAFLHGKDIENRQWHPSRYGGRVGMYLALHGGAAKPATYALEMFGALRWFQELELIPSGPVNWDNFTCPGIVAVARLIDVRRDSSSLWADEGQFHWVLEVTALPQAVPHRGGKGLWEIEADALAQVRAGWRQAQ